MNRILIALCALLCVMPAILFSNDALPPTEARALYETSAKEAPIVFIPNRGQIVDSEGRLRPDLLFSTSSSGLKMYLRRTGISYVFARVEEKAASQGPISEATGKPMQHSPTDGKPTEDPLVSVYRVDMEFEGCNTDAEVLGEEETKQYFNYYLAHCPEGITNVHGFKRVVYKNIYDNIDLVFHSSRYGIKYDFVVRPGGDPSDIQMKYENAGDIGLKANRLRMSTPLGAIEEQAPVTYAIANGTYKPLAMNGRPVRSRFVLQDSTVGFAVEKYDENQTLVIDPYVLWSTYLGGEGKDHVEGVTVEVLGEHSRYDGRIYNGTGENPTQRVIVTGWTLSAGFPVFAWNGKRVGVYQGETDAFLAAISTDGEMEWYTFFGGDKFDRADAIACVNPFRYGNGSESNYISSFYAITGQTRSESGIADAVPGYTTYQNTFGGSSDAFIATFNYWGHKLWSTYIGGTAKEYGYDIAINVEIGEDSYTATIGITGQTHSTDFPVVPSGAVADWIYHGKGDAFAATFTDEGEIVWSRCFGGGYEDAALAIDVDASSNWIIGGWTKSTDMPGEIMFDRQSGGGSGLEADVDMMLAMFSNAGSVLRSSYYGDQYADYCTAVAFTGNGEHIVVGGYTHAAPTNSSYTWFTESYQQAIYGGGSYDGVLLKFATEFNDEPSWWSTLYGGDNDDRIEDVAIDYYGDIWVVGRTNSSPTTNIADGRLIGYEWDQSTDDWKVLQDGRQEDPPDTEWDHYSPVYDTFLAKFNPEGDRTWSSYYGKKGSDIGVSISSGYFYGIAVAGWTDPLHSDEEIPLFHTDALQSVANSCDEGYVMLMREFGFPIYKYYGDAINDIAVDSKDHIIISGVYTSGSFPATVGSHQTTALADINGTLTKLDSTGAYIWATYFGGTHKTTNPVLAINSNDDILVGAGQDWSTGGWGTIGPLTWKFDPDSDEGNGYLALFTKNGLLINSITLDAEPGKGVHISDVCFGPDDAIFVFGTTNSDHVFGTIDATSGRGGDFDGFIARYSSGLINREWGKYWGGTGQDILTAGTITPNNEIVVVGWTDHSHGSTPHFPTCGNVPNSSFEGYVDGFVSKLDCSGNCSWSRFIGGGNLDYMLDVKVAADGTVVVAGETASSNFPVTVGVHSGLYDITLNKLNGSNGQLVWGTYIGGNGLEGVASLMIDIDGAVVLFGETQSNNFPTSINALQPERIYPDRQLGCIMKFNTLNQMEWSTYLGGNEGGVSNGWFRTGVTFDSRNHYLFSVSVGVQHKFSREAASYNYPLNSTWESDGRNSSYYKLTKDGQLWSAP